MKRILSLLAFLLVSLVGMAQAPTNYTNINGRYRWIAGMFDSTFHIPKGTTPSLRTGGSTNAGALFYKTSDSTIYYYTGSRWLKLSDSMRYVPYTGAINNVDLGTYGLTGDFIKLNVSPSGVPSTESTMSWNNTDGTMDIKLKGGAVTLQVGQEQVVRVVNKTGSNLLESEYKAVYLSGAQGQRAKIDLAQANSALGNMTIGLVTENIDNNNEGYITSNGLVRGINTTGSLQGETWADGDALYLSPTTAGALTNIAPSAPNYQISIGVVVNAHSSQGSIFVKVGFSEALNDLSDVQLNGLANNDLLVYESSSSLWKNKTFSAAGGITGSGTTNYVSKFTSASAIGNSSIFDNGTSVGIGTASPSATYKLEVNGEASINGVRVGRGAGNDASNTAVGASALNANTTALNNSAFGNQALLSTTSGGMNVALGVTAMRFNTTGFQNVAVGVSAGHFTNSYGSNAASDNSVYLGYETKASASGNTNEIVIGASALGGGSNTVTLGNSSILNTYLKGQANVATINNATTDTDKFLVSDGGVVKYRTGAEVLSDIGGASSSSISGTTNYIPKFTSSSAIGNSALYEGTNGVGINTASPQNDAGYKALTINGTSGGQLGFQVGGTLTHNIYGDASRLALVSISSLPITFSTNSSERMRLDASGNLGINTSSPARKLDVNGTGRFTGDLTISNSSRLFLNGTTGQDWALRTNASTSNFEIVDWTTEVARISMTASGNLGLGTSSPSRKLSVVGSAVFTDGTNDVTIWNDGSIGTNGNLSLKFNTNGTLKATLDASGNLGLGVTPSAWGSAFKAMQINVGGAVWGSTNVTEVNIGGNTRVDVNNAQYDYISTGAASQYQQSGGQHLWKIAPSGTAGNAISFTQAMTLFSTGNLAVGGTSDAGYRLDITGTGRYHSSGGGEVLRITGGNGFVNSMYIGVPNTSAEGLKLAYNSNDGSSEINNIYNASLYLKTNNTTRLTIAGSGAATFSSSVTATSFNGTTNNIFSVSGTEGMRLTSTGLGIGTSSPVHPLDIINSGGTGLSTRNAETNYSILRIGTDVTNGYAFVQSGKSGTGTTLPIAFRIDANEHMRLTSTGLGIGTTSPTSTLHTNGSLAAAYSSKTATYTLTSSDHTIRFDAVTAAASLTANLPDATTCTGRIYVIIAKMSASYNVTLDGNGTQTIGGSTTWGLWDGCNLDATIVIQSDGANWQIISYYAFNSTC